MVKMTKNKSKYHNLEKLTYFFNILNSISNQSNKGFTEKMSEALEALVSVIPSDAAQILLLNEDKMLVTMVSQNLDKSVRDLKYKLGEGAIGTAAKENKIYVCKNLKQGMWTPPVRSAYEDVGEYRNMLSVIVAPFYIKETAGVIELLNKRMDWYKKTDFDNIQAILSPFALFVGNAIKERNHALDIVQGIYDQLEAKHKEYEGHANRVQIYAIDLFRELRRYQCTEVLEKYENEGLDNYEERLRKGAFLHDIGKIRFQDDLLDSQEPFTKLTNPFKDHCIFGYNILKERGVTDSVILNCALHHHQNYDGTGYPAIDQGTKISPLVGREIPFEARILRVVDCFDALTSERHYRLARGEPLKYGPAEAIAIMKKDHNQFDEFILDIFIREVIKDDV